MEQKLLKIILIQLKLMAAGCIAFMVVFLSTAFRPDDPGDGVWKEMGITKSEGEDYITESFLRGYLYVNNASSLKNIVNGNRSAVTKDVLTHCKQHVTTESFHQQYKEYRKKIKPLAPVIKNKEQIRTELVSNYEELLKDNQAMVNYALVMKNVEMQKKALKSVADCRKILEEVNAGTSKLLTEQMIYADMRYKSELDRNQVQICEWEKNYPADVRQLVRRRLEYFLEITKDIDFSAVLKEVGGKKIFINPDYEHKPAEWKMGYRAGKDVVQTARTFAGQWMKEL